VLCLASSLISSWRGFFAAHTPDRPQPVDGFSRRTHDSRVLDAFGSVIYASRNDVGFRANHGPI